MWRSCRKFWGWANPGISTQLAQLKKASLVSVQRSGKNNIYSARPEKELLDIARKAGAELEERDKDLASLHHVLNKRKDRTRAYFDELAGKFGRHYVPGRSWKALAEGLLKILDFKVVADLEQVKEPSHSSCAEQSRLSPSTTRRKWWLTEQKPPPKTVWEI